MSMVESTVVNVGPAAMEQRALFLMKELRRVGTAATLIVVCGTIIILTMTLAMGHYNSLAHAGPKAVADGFVLSLLMGPRGRWRMVALLGVVYGLVLVMQVGVIYLAPVMVMTGIIAAMAGWCVDRMGGRLAAVIVAAALYEWLAGFGAPIKIYFATDGQSEPILWTMWMLEWPLRIIGAVCGVMLARKFVRRREDAEGNYGVEAAESAEQMLSRCPMARSSATTDANQGAVEPINRAINQKVPGHKSGENLRRSSSTGQAAVRLSAAMLACTLPMGVQSSVWLSVITAGYIGYGLWLGMRKSLLGIFAALLWGWLMFGLGSYLWHQDFLRVQDLGRTLVLRFAPLAIASSALVRSTRSVDLLRLLAAMYCPRVILIPLAQVLRSAGGVQRQWRQQQAIGAGGRKGWRARMLGPLDRCRPILVAWCDQLRRG